MFMLHWKSFSWINKSIMEKFLNHLVYRYIETTLTLVERVGDNGTQYHHEMLFRNNLFSSEHHNFMHFIWKCTMVEWWNIAEALKNDSQRVLLLHNENFSNRTFEGFWLIWGLFRKLFVPRTKNCVKSSDEFKSFDEQLRPRLISGTFLALWNISRLMKTINKQSTWQFISIRKHSSPSSIEWRLMKVPRTLRKWN